MFTVILNVHAIVNHKEKITLIVPTIKIKRLAWKQGKFDESSIIFVLGALQMLLVGQSLVDKEKQKTVNSDSNCF